MKVRNDFNKYGLITMIGWNILLIVLILIVSTIKGFPFTYIFDDGTGGIGMTIFLLLWSLIWYGIGYKSRKDYVVYYFSLIFTLSLPAFHTDFNRLECWKFVLSKRSKIIICKF